MFLKGQNYVAEPRRQQKFGRKTRKWNGVTMMQNSTVFSTENTSQVLNSLMVNSAGLCNRATRKDALEHNPVKQS